MRGKLGLFLADAIYVSIWLLAIGALVYPLLRGESERGPICGVDGPPPSWGLARMSDSAQRPLESLWLAAFHDARISDPHEVVNDLWEIGASNPRLEWQDHGDQRRVLVASLMHEKKFEGLFGAGGTRTQGMVPANQDVWVTPVPQLREFCRDTRLADKELEQRVKQYLGLKWDWRYLGVVELWVRPEDLFRPCPDREISDRSCSLEDAARADLAPNEGADGWYCRLRAKSYQQNGAPWTRLGYTYDWSGDSETHVGASEYVLEPGAVVELAGHRPIATYCRQGVS